MRLCILHPYYDPNDPSVNIDDLVNYPKSYLNHHHCEVHFLKKETLESSLTSLVQKGFDVFINLCDGSTNPDDDSPGIKVIEILEQFGAAFTGANSSFYEPTRVQMKRVCRSKNVKTPGYVFAASKEQAQKALKLSFPMIVKPPNGYGSVGITQASRVETPEAFNIQIETMLTTYGAVLIEEFIEGREITVLVSENPDDSAQPVVYKPLEFVLPEGETFLHYDLKWSTDADVDYEFIEEPKLVKRLQDATRKLFLGLNGVGYARCDTRVTEKGEVYVLEINPNCGMFFPASDPGCSDYILQHSPHGIEGFLEHMIQAALKHQQARVAVIS
jgi:D-alanine-D-alanine ligase-like ATP-grasp enzyme